MRKLDSPFQLSPVFKPKIWGRRDLRPLFTRPREFAGELLGEVWVTDGASRFLNGPLSGMTLSEASEKFGPELNGSGWTDSRFPILAKYIYTSDWLSVQVHPDDEAARRYDPGNLGKTEMWYIVGATHKAKVLLGLKRNESKPVLRESFEKARSRDVLNAFRPYSGEAIFVPPGTVHALGPGLVLFEVEQNSDLTYRLDDYGRTGLDGKPRPLHLDKGMDVTRPELPALRDLPQVQLREPYGARRFVLCCRFFAVEELTLRKTGTFQGCPARVEILALLEGEGRLETEAGWFGYQTGSTWLVPPATAKYRLVPRVKSRLLKFYVPDIEADFRRPLVKRGVKAAKLKRIIFD
jgi:mannose-6-phosphate isomerase